MISQLYAILTWLVRGFRWLQAFFGGGPSLNGTRVASEPAPPTPTGLDTILVSTAPQSTPHTASVDVPSVIAQHDHTTGVVAGQAAAIVEQQAATTKAALAQTEAAIHASSLDELASAMNTGYPVHDLNKPKTGD